MTIKLSLNAFPDEEGASMVLTLSAFAPDMTQNELKEAINTIKKELKDNLDGVVLENCELEGDAVYAMWYEKDGYAAPTIETEYHKEEVYEAIQKLLRTTLENWEYIIPFGKDSGRWKLDTIYLDIKPEEL